MGRQKIVLDVQHLIKLYQSGMSCESVGKKLGVCAEVVRYRLIENGIIRHGKSERGKIAWKTRGYTTPPDLVDRYVRGESLKSLADHYGMARGGIHHRDGKAFGLLARLMNAGVKIRGRSSAERLKWSGMSIKKRASQTLAAHRARCSPDEKKIILELASLGVPMIHQFTIGKYHVDIALHGTRVAVELQRIWPLKGNVLAEYKSRLKDMLDARYAIVYVVGTLTSPQAVAQNIVAFAKAVRGNKSMLGRYGMIGGNGEPCAVPCSDFDPLPFVPGSTDAQDRSANFGTPD